jgi:hypothetical protein
VNLNERRDIPMDMEIKDRFIRLWEKHFDGAELPITFYYSNSPEQAELVKPESLARCVIGALVAVWKGQSLSFNADSIGCFGGRKYLGFAENTRPDFEYFLSCGIPGKMEGERYKKSPELVKEILKVWPNFKAPAPYIIFKKWDNLKVADEPEVVIFFSTPDVLSGLFTLVNFDESKPDVVITPMGSGCSSIVSYPYMERDALHPRAVLGMFDPSARPYIPRNVLSFSVPMKRFVAMVENMDESFLITDSWQKIQKRITEEFTKIDIPKE